MKNSEIRKAAKENGVHLWEVADALGMADTSFSRKLRREFSVADKAHALAAIQTIAKSHEEESA